MSVAKMFEAVKPTGKHESKNYRFDTLIYKFFDLDDVKKRSRFLMALEGHTDPDDYWHVRQRVVYEELNKFVDRYVETFSISTRDPKEILFELYNELADLAHIGYCQDNNISTLRESDERVVQEWTATFFESVRGLIYDRRPSSETTGDFYKNFFKTREDISKAGKDDTVHPSVDRSKCFWVPGPTNYRCQEMKDENGSVVGWKSAAGPEDGHLEAKDLYTTHANDPDMMAAVARGTVMRRGVNVFSKFNTTNDLTPQEDSLTQSTDDMKASYREAASRILSGGLNTVQKYLETDLIPSSGLEEYLDEELKSAYPKIDPTLGTLPDTTSVTAGSYEPPLTSNSLEARFQYVDMDIDGTGIAVVKNDDEQTVIKIYATKDIYKDSAELSTGYRIKVGHNLYAIVSDIVAEGDQLKDPTRIQDANQWFNVNVTPSVNQSYSIAKGTVLSVIHIKRIRYVAARATK